MLYLAVFFVLLEYSQHICIFLCSTIFHGAFYHYKIILNKDSKASYIVWFLIAT